MILRTLRSFVTTAAFLRWGRLNIAAIAVSCGFVGLEVARAETNGFQAVTDGVAYRHDVLPEPWSIHLLRIDRGRDDLRYLPILGQFDRIGLNTLSTQVKQVPHRFGEVIAAINGDFYKTEGEPMPGDPRGLFVSRGEVISAPADRDCLWFDTNGAPHVAVVQNQFTIALGNRPAIPFLLNEANDGTHAAIYSGAGSFGARGGKSFVLGKKGNGVWLPLRMGATYQATLRERLDDEAPVPDDGLVICLPNDLAQGLEPGIDATIKTATTPDLTGIEAAIGGGPAMVHGGKRQEMKIGKANERHPRTAVGWNSTNVFFVVVDGRQNNSVGMTLVEMADYFVSLGCDEAMNLDGGGSTEMIVSGKIVNSPCYGSERSSASGLTLLRPVSAKTKAPATIHD